VEVPAIGIAMYIIMKTGKKWLFSAAFFATGVSCLLAAIFEGNQTFLWLKIAFVMIGWFIYCIKGWIDDEKELISLSFHRQVHD
jgi:xanthine/uracil permease